jgi:sigma-B regulation protein RsbU (phosphoserine phosphatase)
MALRALNGQIGFGEIVRSVLPAVGYRTRFQLSFPMGRRSAVNLKSPYLLRLFRQQFIYIALAAVVGETVWANGLDINPVAVVVYTITIANPMTISLEALRFLYWDEPFPRNWVIYVGLMLVLMVPVYVIATLLVYWVAPPETQTLAHYLRTGWRLPILITIVYGTITFLYDSTKDRLERHNRELQQTLERGSAKLEMQAQELQRAREIQQSLLPKKIPQLPGFEVAGAWQPARMVGGDYYDVLRLSEHKIAFCIADVVGKGVPAALLMANVQATVRAFANDLESPARVCSRVNSVLCGNIGDDKFVTFFYGILDNKARTMQYCNAGHCYPILVSGGSVRTLDCGGAVLGVFP